jgi:hypothetical protein
MTALEKERGTAGKPSERSPLAVSGPLKETRTAYLLGEELLLPAGDATLREVVCELFQADVANMTPVRALVLLNQWQGRLRGKR